MRYVAVVLLLLVGCDAIGIGEGEEPAEKTATEEPMTGRWVIPKKDGTSYRADLEIIESVETEDGGISLVGNGSASSGEGVVDPVTVSGRHRGDSVFLSIENADPEAYPDIRFEGILDAEADVHRDTALVGVFTSEEGSREEGRFRKVDALYY